MCTIYRYIYMRIVDICNTISIQPVSLDTLLFQILCLSFWHTHTQSDTHACRLFSPAYTILPPGYSQLVVIPRLRQDSTISPSVRFMPNLMSPCHTFLRRRLARQPFTRSPPPFCTVIASRSYRQVQVHLARSRSRSNRSLPSALNNHPLPACWVFLHAFIFHLHDSFLRLWTAPSVFSASFDLQLQQIWQPSTGDTKKNKKKKL